MYFFSVLISHAFSLTNPHKGKVVPVPHHEITWGSEG